MKILATAYAVNPYKGSEDGMGWQFACQIARFNQVLVITRKNNRPHIEKYMKEHPNQNYQNLEFAYFDLPVWMRFWKRGGRGAMLYFFLWQMFMPLFVKLRRFKFDIAHNLNFHTDWMPTFLWMLGKPTVWGPIGHHSAIPKEYIEPFYGKKAYQKDQLKWKIKQWSWKRNPFFKLAFCRSNLILTMNSQVQKNLQFPSEKLQLMPSVASEGVSIRPKKHFKERFNILSVGRFVPLKGFDVTINAFAQFYYSLEWQEQQNVSLTIIGKGPYKKQLQALAKELNINHAITFVDWIERSELADIYSQSDAFLFPSHEGAGMVVSEAISYGLPVVCFDNSGPGEFIKDRDCGIAIPYLAYEKAINKFAGALRALFSSPSLREAMSIEATNCFQKHFHWDRRGEQLNEVYQKVANTEMAKTCTIKEVLSL